MITRYRTTPFTHPFTGLMNGLINRDISQALGHDDVPNNTPKVNITESKDGFGLEITVPGFSKDQIQITMDENVLKIKGEKEKEETKEGENFLRREFNTSSFERSFSLPDSVNAEGITAEVIHGVLRIGVPKMEPAKPAMRQIAIN